MTIQLFNSLLAVSTNINKIILPFVIFSNNFAFKQNYYNSIEYHNIKCWKSKCILNYRIEDDDNSNHIFKLNFSINDNNDNNDSFIKIDYLDINNVFYSKRKKILTNDKVKLVRIIKFIENWAIKKNINKIIIDIHNNLDRYDEELKNIGFIITKNKCLLNHHWFIAEKQLK